MLENGKINVRQFTILVILYVIGGSILLVQSGLAVEAKQDAWIAAILAVGIGLLLLPLYNALGKHYPDKTLAEFSEDILGKWLGKIVSLWFFSYWFILAAILVRAVGYFVTTAIMPETPIEIINLVFLSIIIMGVRLGLEVFTRSAEIFFPWVIMLFVTLVVFLIPQIEFQKMQPMFEEGIKPIVRATFSLLGIPFLELINFLYIYPYVNNKKELGKALFVGTLIGGIMIIIITVLTILVLGADLTARNTYPSYALAKKINIGGFLERLESIMAGLWFVTIFYRTIISFYASTLGLAQTLKLKDHKPLILPLGMILLVLSIMMTPSETYFHTFIAKIWTPYTLPTGLLLPLLLLGVARFRKKFGLQAKKNMEP